MFVRIECAGEGHPGGMAKTKHDSDGKNTIGPKGWMKSAARFVRSLDRSPATLFEPFLAVRLDLIE